MEFSRFRSSNRVNEMSRLLDEKPKKDPLRDVTADDDLLPSVHVNDQLDQHDVLPQLVATIIVSWLSIVVGYASAYSSPAESTMIDELNITKNEATWICSLLPVGALVGSLSGGAFVDCLGRKNTLIVADVFFFLGWSINYFSQNSWSMYVSRTLNGYSVGVTSFALPVYLAETLQPTIRGRLGLFPTVFGNFGILICFLSGNMFGWRNLAAIGGVFTIPFLLSIWLIPETPRWYLSKRKTRKARVALQWLRGRHHNITKEMEELQMSTTNKNRKWTKSQLRVFGIALGLMFFQQFSGINAVIFYTTQIFEDSGTSLDPSMCTAVIGVVNFVATFIAAGVVDRLGRKILLYTSSLVTASMLAILGLYFYLLKVKHIDLTFVEWLPLSCFILYVLGFSVGLGPIPWLMMGEILPAAIRGPAASAAAAFNWSCTFVVTKTFPIFVDSLGAHYAFWFYGMAMIFSLLFLKLVVPETKKRTLEDIERILAAN